MTRPGRDLRVASDLDLPRFWRLLGARHPREGQRMSLLRRRSRCVQRPLPDLGLVVTLYLSEADGHAGVFFGLNARTGVDLTRLDPVADLVRERLDEQPYTSGSYGLHASIWVVDLRDERNWPAVGDWLVAEADRLEQAARYALASASR